MSWSKIVGHRTWIDAFAEVIRRRRLAHAYLFVGPQGVGKRLFARELAKAMLCEHSTPEKFEACDTCASCQLVDAGTHPDLFLVGKPEDKNEMPVETMRELCGNFSLKSSRGRGKVGILDDADDLNEESANCFLKTLEEPPPGSVFILLCTSLEGQLPTIRSRCQTIRFAPLTEAETKEVLSRQELADPTLLPRLLHLAGGSPGQALELADPAIWEARNLVLAGLAQPKIDAVGLGKRITEFAEDAGKETVLHRQRANRLLRLLLQAWQDAARVTVGGQPPSADAEDARLLQSLAQGRSAETFLSLMERSLEAETQIGRYIQLGLVLEGLLESWAQILERGRKEA
jgi:DNA polymerase-3 subunit delta'